MIGITQIASFIPDVYEDNREKMERFEVEESFLVNKIGVERTSRMPHGTDTSDLCVGAYRNLMEKRPDIGNADCLIVCTQNPDGNGIPHTSAVVHGKLGLNDSCACFDISLGCSGYVYGLSIIKGFMESMGYSTGLLFTADPYSKGLDPDDRDTVFLFGDAATVTLLEQLDEHSGFVPGHFVLNTHGTGGKALNNDDGSIRMNGRAIFEFAVRNVPVQIKGMLEQAGTTVDEVDLFLLHQGSRFIVEKIGQSLRLPEGKVPVKLVEYGNTVSSSIPLLLEDYMNSDYTTLVLAGFGVGLSWASCLLHKKNGGQV